MRYQVIFQTAVLNNLTARVMDRSNLGLNSLHQYAVALAQEMNGAIFDILDIQLLDF
jgi:hypothetical protein